MARRRRQIVLVFGEDDNDRSSLIELVKAIRPNATVSFEKRAKPPVLLRSSEKPATRRSTAEEIARLVKTAMILDDVVAVVAHRDCDAVEPAHENVALEIEGALNALKIPNVVAAAPAYELESWWLLFPEAVNSVRSCWRKLKITRHVGMISDAKEYLARSLRPTAAADQKRCPEYSESDSVIIARKIKEMNLVRRATPSNCASLYEFTTKIDALSM